MRKVRKQTKKRAGLAQKFCLKYIKYVNGKIIHLGHFKTIEEASFAYQKARKEYIKTLAEKYKNELPEQVYQALINYQVQIIY